MNEIHKDEQHEELRAAAAEERATGERVASGIMKVLAILGLIALLALAAWLTVGFVRFIPNAGERLSGAVAAITSVFRAAPDESLSLDLPRQPMLSGEQVTIGWTYTGEQAPERYAFSYSCADSATFEIFDGGGWVTQQCDTPYETSSRSLEIVPVSNNNRYLDIDVTVAEVNGDLRDTSLVTVENPAVADSRSGLMGATSTTSGGATTTPKEDEREEAPARPTPTPRPVTVEPKPAPKPTAPVVTAPKPVVVTRPVATGPADLVVDIKETGILSKARNGTFFPVSPIPSDKIAAVRFTVTNIGGQPSGAWAFKASLPIEGDEDYRYTSPAQASIAPGTQVEFTLGFDEVLEEKRGVIRIELVPTNKTDKTTNNKDAVAIEIRKK